MNLPYKIEISVDGSWIEIGDDHDREYACSRVESTHNDIDHFTELLAKCGWSGPAIGEIRLRNVESGEIISSDRCPDERRRLEDLSRTRRIA